MDSCWLGKIATIESIEQDYEGGLHVAIVIEDDPGKDLGGLRQPGHRFFFKSEEIESVVHRNSDSRASGTFFSAMMHSATEVVRRSSERSMPPENPFESPISAFADYDLTYALLDATNYASLWMHVRAAAEPGTVYVMEPDPGESNTREQTRRALTRTV